jgi:hypothetical protein
MVVLSARETASRCSPSKLWNLPHILSSIARCDRGVIGRPTTSARGGYAMQLTQLDWKCSQFEQLPILQQVVGRAGA